MIPISLNISMTDIEKLLEQYPAKDYSMKWSILPDPNFVGEPPEDGPCLPPVWCKDPETKALVSQQIGESNRIAWDGDEERRSALILKNKTTHGAAVRKAWAEGKYEGRPVYGRPKGAKDLTPRKQKPQRKVMHENKVYANAFVAAKVYGIHPVNIRRRCRLEKYPDWKYL
jgi:hypothetical protein